MEETDLDLELDKDTHNILIAIAEDAGKTVEEVVQTIIQDYMEGVPIEKVIQRLRNGK